MSTQAARSIRLTHGSQQRAFRLLELTPEIVELLSADNAPVLHLKSPPSDPSGQDVGYVNLCTPDKTFRIRQVQSSNSIHLVQPSTGENSQLVPLKQQQAEERNNGNDEWADTVSAIAKCASTLEVHGLDEGSATSVVAQALAKNLRVYEADRNDVDMADESQPEVAVTRGERESIKRTIIADVPFSDAECNAAWTEICAFVHVDTENNKNIVGFRPSARMKIDAWKRILEGSVLQSIDLEKQFLANDLWKAVLSDDDDKEEEPFPRPLFDALLNRLVERSGSQPMELKWSNLDKNASVKWIGETYLEAFAPIERSSIGRSEFLHAWKDLLPEAWRGEASLDVLPPNSYKSPDPVSICFVKESERNELKKTAGAAAAKNSRNWHERFRSQRK
ncbi:hypothetical protein PISL3812_01105 [Talaromyces islandicus]|uniref:Sister chromatid cohesion protein Dcc1 n=1 Tax=Talaromyces islandicus TaxID=28573 RepID=A0A0U1LL42_TALIS|nr:hypothetical protein PISL3812_01105 [Talaromyces islandicus]